MKFDVAKEYEKLYGCIFAKGKEETAMDTIQSTSRKEPTIEELRAFFLANDFSAMGSEVDYDTMDADDVELFEVMKSVMDKHWEPLSREMGLKSPSQYYGKDHPLIALRDSMENATAAKALDIATNQPDVLEKLTDILITEKTMQDPEKLLRLTNEMLHEKVEMIMQVMDYESVATLVNEVPAFEDFNHSKQGNFRAMDFDKKWNHSRAMTKLFSLEEMQESALEGSSTGELFDDPTTTVEENVITNMIGQTFWDALSENDKELLQMRISGMNQAEIAQQLHYKTHSAVTKRLQKLKELFLQLT